MLSHERPKIAIKMSDRESRSTEPVGLVATSTNTDVGVCYRGSCYLRIGLVVTGSVVVVGGSVVVGNFLGRNL